MRGVILWRSGSVRSYKSRNNVIFQLLLYYMTHPWHSPYTCLQTKKKSIPLSASETRTGQDAHLLLDSNEIMKNLTSNKHNLALK